MITNIEKKITIKNSSRKLDNKLLLVSKYNYIPNNIIKTLDNKVINLEENKIVLSGMNVILDNANKIILDKESNGLCMVYDINGTFLFSSENIWVLSDKLFARNTDKVDLLGNKIKKVVLCNDKGKVINRKNYDALISYSCNRIIAIKDKKYGVIDNLGNTIVKSKYDYISKYNNNVAIAKDNEGYFLIDVFGNIITKEKYNCISLYDNMYKVEKNGLFGYIDNLGNTIIPPIYKFIGCFEEDLAVIEINNKYGYINKSNELVIEPVYDEASSFDNGYAKVKKDKDLDEEILYIIDKQGNTIFKSPEDLVNISSQNEGLYIATKIKEDNTTKLGYINEFGDTIIPFIYDEAYPFKDNLAVVKQNNKCGVIDKNNNLIVDFKYDYISNFYNNYAVIRNDNYRKYGLINNQGKTILPPVFDNIILLNDNNIYVEGYIYDINKIELDYKIIIKDDDRFIVKNFNTEKEMNNYYNLFINEYTNFMEKLELTNPKKLVKNK